MTMYDIKGKQIGDLKNWLFQDDVAGAVLLVIVLIIIIPILVKVK